MPANKIISSQKYSMGGLEVHITWTCLLHTLTNISRYFVI